MASLPSRLAARMPAVSVARQSSSFSRAIRKTSPSRSIVSRQLSQAATLTTQALAPPETHEEKVSRQCSPGQVPSMTIAPEWVACPSAGGGGSASVTAPPLNVMYNTLRGNVYPAKLCLGAVEDLETDPRIRRLAA